VAVIFRPEGLPGRKVLYERPARGLVRTPERVLGAACNPESPHEKTSPSAAEVAKATQ